MKNTATLLGISKNIMGTISIDLKIKGMRKAQDFIFYPINADTRTLIIQSDTRIGSVLLDGSGMMSKPHTSGAYFHHLQLDPLTSFTFSPGDWNQIKDYIGLTASVEAGKAENGVMFSDNSEAKNIFNL